eukprot:1161300-Pelagomonas_calceolata.AAC.7
MEGSIHNSLAGARCLSTDNIVWVLMSCTVDVKLSAAMFTLKGSKILTIYAIQVEMTVGCMSGICIKIQLQSHIANSFLPFVQPSLGQKGMGGPCTILRQKIQKRAEPVIAASWSADGATVAVSVCLCEHPARHLGRMPNT